MSILPRANSIYRHSREGGNPATFAFPFAAVRAKSLGPRLRGDDDFTLNFCGKIS
jgi:hypothetical protein